MHGPCESWTRAPEWNGEMGSTALSEGTNARVREEKEKQKKTYMAAATLYMVSIGMSCARRTCDLESGGLGKWGDVLFVMVRVPHLYVWTVLFIMVACTP